MGVTHVPVVGDQVGIMVHTAHAHRPVRIRSPGQVRQAQVILDPGIALNYRGDYEAYTRMQLQVIADSEQLRDLGRPVLIPIPRKRDFHRVVAYIALALEHKADIIRVHDVAVACDLARLFGRDAAGSGP